jgi:hypothetical protein
MRFDEEPTNLAAIRGFLRGQGAVVTPWSTPAAAVEGLFALLEARRGDDRFWIELERLIGDLEDRRFAPRSRGGAEIIADGEVDMIVHRLRSELPAMADGTTRSRLTRWIGSSASAPALLAFLLLGSSVGCEGSCAKEAAEHGIEGGDADVYCELAGLINEADIAWNLRVNLLDCLPELDAADREWLLEAFGEANDEELADLLEEMSTSWACDDDAAWQHGDNGSH